MGQKAESVREGGGFNEGGYSWAAGGFCFFRPHDYRTKNEGREGKREGM